MLKSVLVSPLVVKWFLTWEWVWPGLGSLYSSPRKGWSWAVCCCQCLLHSEIVKYYESQFIIEIIVSSSVENIMLHRLAINCAIEHSQNPICLHFPNKYIMTLVNGYPIWIYVQSKCFLKVMIQNALMTKQLIEYTAFITSLKNIKRNI